MSLETTVVDGAVIRSIVFDGVRYFRATDVGRLMHLANPSHLTSALDVRSPEVRRWPDAARSNLYVTYQGIVQTCKNLQNLTAVGIRKSTPSNMKGALESLMEAYQEDGSRALSPTPYQEAMDAAIASAKAHLEALQHSRTLLFGGDF